MCFDHGVGTCVYDYGVGTCVLTMEWEHVF